MDPTILIMNNNGSYHPMYVNNSSRKTEDKYNGSKYDLETSIMDQSILNKATIFGVNF